MISDPDCIFCKIVAGTIPCFEVYRDEHVLAFLDIGPLSRGHLLVIPLNHRATLAEMTDDEAAACGRVLPRLARAMVKVTGTREYNILQNNGKGAGQVVGHVHFHLIPKEPGGAGLGIQWPAGSLDKEAAANLQQAISAALE